MDALAGFLAGVLASMGLGGGFVLVLWLTLVREVSQRAAQGINVLFFLPIAFIALVLHLRGGLVDKRLVMRLIPGGILGAVLGTLGAQALPNGLLRRLYALFLLAFGLRELFAKGDSAPPARAGKCAKPGDRPPAVDSSRSDKM